MDLTFLSVEQTKDRKAGEYPLKWKQCKEEEKEIADRQCIKWDYDYYFDEILILVNEILMYINFNVIRRVWIFLCSPLFFFES